MPNLTLTTASTVSNALSNLDDAIAIGIVAPTAVTGTITVQVEPTATGTAFVSLQSGGVDVTIAAAKAIVINPFPFRQIRLITSATEAATRTFSVLRTMPT